MFSHLEFWWLALALPVLGAALVVGHRLRLQAKRVYGTENLMDRFNKQPASRMHWIHPAGTFLAAVLLVIAALGPMANTTKEKVPDGSLQMVTVIDVSKSMLAEDYREVMPADAGEKPDLNRPWGSRLDMAKYQLGRIMKQIRGNQLGIVNYAEFGFAQADLTSDFTALDFVIKNWLTQGNAPGYGSHYENGLKDALEMFKRDEMAGKNKVIVVMSDGGFDGNPEELAKVVEEINKQKIKVIVIGIGMPGENAIPIYDGGKLTGYFTAEGKTITTSYEEDHLRQLAAATHGTYYHVDAGAAGKDLGIDLGDTVGGFRTELRGTPLFPYFGGAAFAIVVVLSVIGFSKKKKQ